MSGGVGEKSGWQDLSGEGLAPNLILSSESSRLQLMCDMLLVSE